MPRTFVLVSLVLLFSVAGGENLEAGPAFCTPSRAATALAIAENYLEEMRRDPTVAPELDVRDEKAMVTVASSCEDLYYGETGQHVKTGPLANLPVRERESPPCSAGHAAMALHVAMAFLTNDRYSWAGREGFDMSRNFTRAVRESCDRARR